MSHKLRKASDVNFTKDELVFIQSHLLNQLMDKKSDEIRDGILTKIEDFHNAVRLAQTFC